MKSKPSALTLLEVLVALTVLAILAAVFYPTIKSALRGREGVSQPLNNARQLQLATMTMSLDSWSTGKGPSWAYDTNAGRAVSLAELGSNLVAGKYIQSNDVLKLLSAGGVIAKYPLLQSNIAYKIYPVSESDAVNTIFVTTRNWTPYLPLDPHSTPYGAKGFIVMRKGGDGAIYQAKQATNSNVLGVMTTNAGGVPLS